jgi:hypothetical protein
MAKSTPRAGRGPAPRAAAKSKKAATELDVAGDAPGIGIDAGIAILTCVVLVGALVLVDMIQGKMSDGDGIFF